ncbi:protein rolling stone-like [Mytilus trossulus]|uniref:protein rolling stone-like n=1 Tax=Mytilus trossulus TaxID=6551 RepID=UPI0030068D5D
MFKITAKFVQATHGGVRTLQRGMQTYTRYAYYSLNDRKGTQDGSMSQKPYQPRYSLEYDRPEDFVKSQWCKNQNDSINYAIYRTLVALYFLFVVMYSAIVGTLKMKMFIMLTYWSLYTLTACQVLRAYNVWHYISLKRQKKDLQMIKRLKWQWTLYNISVGTAPLVAILYWVIAYDGSGYNFINVNTHGVNAAFILLDTFITRMPVRLLHVYQSLLLGFTYIFFTIIYWFFGGLNQFGQPFIYTVLNYGQSPKKAFIYVMAIIFIVSPLIHSFVFFLYRFRVFIHRYLTTMDKREALVNNRDK